MEPIGGRGSAWHWITSTCVTRGGRTTHSFPAQLLADRGRASGIGGCKDAFRRFGPARPAATQRCRRGPPCSRLVGGDPDRSTVAREPGQPGPERGQVVPASGTGADPPGVELPHPISGAAATRAKRHTLTAGKVKVDFIVRLSHREFHRGNGFHVSSCQKTFFRPSPRITTGSSQPPLCESRHVATNGGRSHRRGAQGRSRRKQTRKETRRPPMRSGSSERGSRYTGSNKTFEPPSIGASHWGVSIAQS